MGPKNLTSVTEFILEGLSHDRNTQILLFVVVLTIYVFTIVGNVMIILLVQAESSLHTPMYFFLTNLSGLDICYISASVPQLLAHLLAGKGVVSFTRCAVQMYIFLSLGCVESYLLCAMAYDRYLAICSPLIYAVAMSRGHQWQLASASWAVGFLISMVDVIPTLCFPYCGPNHINHFVCEVPMVLELACADTHVFKLIIYGVAVVVVVIPLSIILTSYGFILFSVLRMKSGAGRSKAFSTCASHLAVVALYYLTIIAVYMKPESATIADRDKQVAFFYMVITPLLNPVIYTLRNKDVHAAVANVMRRWILEPKL